MRDFIVREDRLSEKERRNLNILDAIRRAGEISRAEISKVTDLNIVTVSNYVSKYVKSKLVLETGLDISSGGRRPELLKLNPEYKYTIGIDLGSPHLTIDPAIVGVILDVNGKVVAKEKSQKEKESFEKLTEKVLVLTEKLIKKSGVSSKNIQGIGVGIWGVLDRYRGMVRYAVEEEQIVSYANLVSQLENKFNVSVVVEHDAALAAFGERWSGIGASSAAEHLIFMCSDSSSGLIVKGELYRGATKSAGELNINPPVSDESREGLNCWESYSYGCCLRSRGLDLSTTDRVKRYMDEHPDEGAPLLEAAEGDKEKIDFNFIVEQAEKGEAVSKKILEEAGEYLGTKIAFLINLFNPEVVVIGRGIERAGDIFFSAVRRSVRKWAYEESVKIVKVLPTSLGEDVVAVGAAAMVTQDMFARM
ncbi:MAG: ROK family protein [Candidatus Omnitrophota bacterium]|jgi:predicted NBD/HSP70 family sugar kinase